MKKIYNYQTKEELYCCPKRNKGLSPVVTHLYACPVTEDMCDGLRDSVIQPLLMLPFASSQAAVFVTGWRGRQPVLRNLFQQIIFIKKMPQSVLEIFFFFISAKLFFLKRIIIHSKLLIEGKV